MAGLEKKNVSMQCVHSNINEKVVELCQKKKEIEKNHGTFPK